MSDHQTNRDLLIPLRRAMRSAAEAPLRRALEGLMAPDAPARLAHPLGTCTGPDALWETGFGPLLAALPDLERRDWIVMAGRDGYGVDWVGAGGHYVGTFAAPFLGIPPTGRLAHMRFHEFFRIEEGRVVEIQSLWDIPELMMQARAWPMAPSLGREAWVPGPASQDGLIAGPRDEAVSDASRDHVVDMLAHLIRHPSQGGPEVMEMERFWHPRFTWYGPAGIGTARGVEQFRAHHQIPFLSAMPDRGADPSGLSSHFFGDGAYAAVTGWPNMRQTLFQGGWLGIAPSGKPIEMRSLDFWRMEDGLIRENWVLVDLLHAHAQTGTDVLARMREMVNPAPPAP